MTSKTDRAISAAFVFAACTIGISAVYRAFASRPSLARPGRVELTYEKTWPELAAIGTTISGDSNAPVTIIEYTDLECPACRGFQPTITELMKRHQHDVRLVYLPFPLTMHRFAMSAARAGECALAAGALPRWVDAVFAKQDSLGIKSWESYATEAGIRDTMAIGVCAKNPAKMPRIEASIASGQHIGIQGTPTILINGWSATAVLSDSVIEQTIAAVARGKRPPNAK